MNPGSETIRRDDGSELTLPVLPPGAHFEIRPAPKGRYEANPEYEIQIVGLARSLKVGPRGLGVVTFSGGIKLAMPVTRGVIERAAAEMASDLYFRLGARERALAAERARERDIAAGAPFVGTW